jgi:hypothetical protein
VPLAHEAPGCVYIGNAGITLTEMTLQRERTLPTIGALNRLFE